MSTYGLLRILSLPRKRSESYTKAATIPPQMGAMTGHQSQYWSRKVKTVVLGKDLLDRMAGKSMLTGRTYRTFRSPSLLS